jgi:hypothetical protein
MFVRFRPVHQRLVVDLVATRRVNGKVKTEHVVRLGSLKLPEPFEPRRRIVFWRELKVRFHEFFGGRLANRVSADDRRKALAAIHARIPKPTPADEQAGWIKALQDDIASREKARAYWAKDTETRRKMISVLEKQIAESAVLEAEEERLILLKQSALAKLLRGEKVIEGSEGL